MFTLGVSTFLLEERRYSGVSIAIVSAAIRHTMKIVHANV